MALTLVRLRWTLTLNQWRRSPFTLVMSVLGALYVLGMAAVAVTLLVTGLPALPDEARGATTVLAAAVVVLAWLVIPPFVTGVDATLDPHSFVLFPVPARTLIAGLVLSAFTTPVGLATLAVLVGLGASWWDRPAALAVGLAVRRTVEPVAVGGGRSRRVAAGADPMPLRWLGRRATGPRTAIAARAQRYWLADPRYAAGLIIIPLMAVLLWFTGGMAAEGGPGLGLLLILGPITAWSLAYSISADIAYDHTAFHLHVVSGVRGVDDRWGRVLGLAGWGVPMILLVTTATVAAAGDWSLLAPMLGLALGLFGTTAGLSAFVSARFVYPVPKPGDSPFATPQGAAMRTMLVQGAAMLVSLALAVPFLVPFVVRLVTGAAVWGWVTVALGLAWGAVALWLGVRLGARWYDRAQAETYQAVAAF